MPCPTPRHADDRAFFRVIDAPKKDDKFSTSLHIGVVDGALTWVCQIGLVRNGSLVPTQQISRVEMRTIQDVARHLFEMKNTEGGNGGPVGSGRFRISESRFLFALYRQISVGEGTMLPPDWENRPVPNLPNVTLLSG